MSIEIGLGGENVFLSAKKGAETVISENTPRREAEDTVRV